MDVITDSKIPAEDLSMSPAGITPSEGPAEKSAEPESQRTAPNGRHTEDEDDNINEELTPPPDTPVSTTPAQESLSHLSTPQPTAMDAEQDEIVVGTKAVHPKEDNSSPHQATSDQDAVEMEEDTEAELEADVAPGPDRNLNAEAQEQLVVLNKRKRLPIDDDDAEENLVDAREPEKSASPFRQSRGVRSQVINPVKGVVLGYWRDSQPGDRRDKHAVIGFIDVRDRLRTRIQTTTRDGRSITSEFPVPPGPGGSWVTFDRIAFDDHLVNLDHFQVKEFVKIRMESARRDETLEEKAELDKAAVKRAIQFLQAHPPSDNAPANLAIAYGPQIPEHARLASRPDKKRRTGSLGPQFANASSLPLATPIHSGAPGPAPSYAVPVDNLPGTRPTRILLGYWKLSSETLEVDKHAVYGILGANDMFRVKLMKETRDGRGLMGNFPTGPGALWIHWDEVEFEPHLASLSRPEIKEYCRVRQRHIDDGERPEYRLANESQAIHDAQKRVEAGGPIVVPRKDEPSATPVPILKARESPATTNGHGYDDGYDAPGSMAAPSIQPKQEGYRRGSRPRHSLPDVELRAANRPQSIDPLERTNSLARREVARLESSQARRDQHEANREAYRSASSSTNGVGYGDGQQQSLFKDDMRRLNKVWVAQEQSRQKAGVEDAKVYNGVKYERKQTGPFQGKLVSQGKIISIDGEDYVEYRVLTKPSFF